MSYLNNCSTALPLSPYPVTTFNEAWSVVWESEFQFNARSGYCENNRYQKHLRNTIGNFRLADITPLMLETMKTKLLKSGRSAQTVSHILKLLKRVFNCMIKYSFYSGENPVRKVTMPSEDSNRQRYLTKEEANLLLERLAIKKSYNRKIGTILVHRQQ